MLIFITENKQKKGVQREQLEVANPVMKHPVYGCSFLPLRLVTLSSFLRHKVTYQKLHLVIELTKILNYRIEKVTYGIEKYP